MPDIPITRHNHNNDGSSSKAGPEAELAILVLGLAGLLVWLGWLIFRDSRHRFLLAHELWNRCRSFFAGRDCRDRREWDMDWASIGELERSDQLAITDKAWLFDDEHGPATFWRRRNGRWINIAPKISLDNA